MTSTRRALCTAGGATLALISGLLAAPGAALAARPTAPSGMTLAVYGDAPYGKTPTDTRQLAATPAFIHAVNSDPDVSEVLHAGDIHSGKQYCTEDYDRQIASLWTQFEDPLVYTPGDNEWTDCHKPGEGGGTTSSSGAITYPHGDVDYAHANPVDNLTLIRSLFFPTPGQTLGAQPMTVRTQAHQPGRAADRSYVENVVWSQAGVTFVTVDIPGGSNNDADPWFGAATESAAQKAERDARTAADLRWIDVAFAQAHSQHSRGVVVLTQADMWDLDGAAPAHLANYEPFVQSLATHTEDMDAPVLLINGDSHGYRSDNPLQEGSPCTTETTVGSTAVGPCSDDAWSNHPSYDVANFHRLVVHGSTAPMEWLKLAVAPDAVASGTDGTTFGPFTWARQITAFGY